MKTNLQASYEIQDSSLEFQIRPLPLRIIISGEQETFWSGSSKSVSSFTPPIILKELFDKRFFLKHEIQISIDEEIDGYILFNNNLNVYVFGETLSGAQLEWESVLVDLYLSYRDTPDDQLTMSGKALKDQLQGAIGESNAD